MGGVHRDTVSEMPPSKVDLSGVALDETATRYLDTRGENTKKAYENCLRRFTLYYGRPFKDFLLSLDAEQKANLDRPIHEKTRPGEDVVRGFIRWHGEAGYANYATLQAMGAVQNILKFYGVTISYAFIETPPPRPMKENDKHEWKLDEVRQFVEAAEYLRDKAYIMFAFQSGLSIGDVLGLDYGDIKREYEAGVMPMAIQRYREKTNVPIRTFIGHDALYYLRLYLGSRPGIQAGEPIFTLLGTGERATLGSIQAKLRDYAGKLGFIYEEDLEGGYNPARPHSLRSAFRSRLTGKMDGDLIEFMMSHDIGQQKATYINMPLDELREIYASYEHLLSIDWSSRQVLGEGAERVPEEVARDLEALKDTVAGLATRNAELERKVELVNRLLEDPATVGLMWGLLEKIRAAKA